MVMEFAIDFQFSCRKPPDGGLVIIDDILNNNRRISKYNDYIGLISSPQDGKFINTFYYVMSRLNSISNKNCLITLNKETDTRIEILFLTTLDNVFMQEKFQRLLDYSFYIMLPLYMKYFNSSFFENPFNFNNKLNSNIVVSNHIPSAFIQDDMSRRVVRFISRLANYISSRIEEDQEEDDIKSIVYEIISKFMIRYARDSLNDRFSVPISRLLHHYDKQDYTTIVNGNSEDYEIISKYFNNIRRKTLILFANSHLFDSLNNIPTFYKLNDNILFYPGVFIVGNNDNIKDIVEISKEDKLKYIVEDYVDTKSRELALKEVV